MRTRRCRTEDAAPQGSAPVRNPDRQTARLPMSEVLGRSHGLSDCLFSFSFSFCVCAVLLRANVATKSPYSRRGSSLQPFCARTLHGRTLGHPRCSCGHSSTGFRFSSRSGLVQFDNGWVCLCGNGPLTVHIERVCVLMLGRWVGHSLPNDRSSAFPRHRLAY